MRPVERISARSGRAWLTHGSSPGRAPTAVGLAFPPIAGPSCWWRPKSAEKWRTQDMGVDFLDRRVLAKRVVDGRKPASGHESQLRQGVASGHPQGRSAAKEPQSGLTRRNPLTFDPTCCGFSHSLFAIYARFYAAVNTSLRQAPRNPVRTETRTRTYGPMLSLRTRPLMVGKW